MSGLLAQRLRQRIGMGNPPVLPYAAAVADARAGVRHRRCCHALRPQHGHPSDARLVLAHPRIVEHHQAQRHRQRELGCTRAAMGDCDDHAPRAPRPQQCNRVHEDDPPLDAVPDFLFEQGDFRL